MSDGKTYTVWVECEKTETFVVPVKVDGAEFDAWWEDEPTEDGLVEFLKAGPEVDIDEALEGQWSVSQELQIIGVARDHTFEVTA